MASLAKDGKYTVTPEMKEKLSDFYGNYTSEKETAEVIKSFTRIQDTLLILIQQLQQVYMTSIRRLQVIQPQRLLLHLQQVHSNSQEV